MTTKNFADSMSAGFQMGLKAKQAKMQMDMYDMQKSIYDERLKKMGMPDPVEGVRTTGAANAGTPPIFNENQWRPKSIAKTEGDVVSVGSIKPGGKLVKDDVIDPAPAPEKVETQALPEPVQTPEQQDTQLDDRLTEAGNSATTGTDVAPEMQTPAITPAEPVINPADAASNVGDLANGMSAFAEGGMVANPDELAMPTSDGPGSLVPQQVPEAPAEGLAPEPAADTANPFTGLGMALHGALKRVGQMFGSEEAPGGAIPETPGASQQNARLLHSQLGAMSQQDYDEVMKTVDPHGRLDDSIRNIAGLTNVYEYYLSRGDLDKAEKTAASMVLYTRSISSRYGAEAEAAIRDGKLSEGAQLLMKGDNAIPDGRKNVPVNKDGKLFIEEIDPRTGEASRTMGPITGEMLLNAAVGMKNGKVYWGQLMHAAKKYLPEVEEGEAVDPAYQKLVQDLYGVKPGVPEAGTAAPKAPGAVTPQVTEGDDGEAAIPDGTKPAAAAAAPRAGDPRAKVPSDKASDKFAVPQTLVSLSGDDVGQPPVTPPQPVFRRMDEATFAQVKDPKQRNQLMKLYNDENARRKTEYDKAMADYKDAAKAWNEGRKAGIPKPLEMRPQEVQELATGVEGSIDAMAPKLFVDPVTKKDFAPKELQEYLAPVRGSIGMVAANIAMMNNSGLRDPRQATATALGLIAPGSNGDLSFKPLGYAAGGHAVVLQVENGQRVVMARDAYQQLQWAHAKLNDADARLIAKSQARSRNGENFDRGVSMMQDSGQAAMDRIHDRRRSRMDHLTGRVGPGLDPKGSPVLSMPMPELSSGIPEETPVE